MRYLSPRHAIPGSLIGVMAHSASSPAFPCEAPAPGPSLSIRVTSWPALRSQIADDSPQIPAPTTTTFFAFMDVFLLCLPAQLKRFAKCLQEPHSTTKNPASEARRGLILPRCGDAA